MAIKLAVLEALVLELAHQIAHGLADDLRPARVAVVLRELVDPVLQFRPASRC